jgi:Fe-S oxidoreductase
VSYPKLLPLHPHSKAVGAATHEFFEYLYTLDTAPSDRLKGKRYGFHCACHQRPLGSGDGAMAWLQRQGANIERIENGTCCGMAGTFGLKHGPLGYDLANAVGEPLFEEFKASAVDAIVTESSVCAIHLGEGTGIPVVHPLELL